jgi:pimeloyl-ACP methyl ester carboxylesterase
MAEHGRRAFVLVAGAWHGRWCWSRLDPLLRARGARVHTPELLATGDDPTPPRAIRLETWARQLCDLVAEESAPVILVGHSRAGAIISRVAELVPERISRLVYLSAYLLASGRSVADEARDDTDSLIAAHMIPEETGVTCSIGEQSARQAFYDDCDAATAGFALARLRPEPLRPLVTPVRVSAERFGTVPRAYLESTRDRTISLAAQRRMQAVWPCDPVLTLESGHSPFLSQPETVAQWLAGL